jgi:hypothetical protein
MPGSIALRLDLLGERRTQPDQHAKRHPDQRRDRNQHHHAQQRDQTEHQYVPYFGEVDTGTDIAYDAKNDVERQQNHQDSPHDVAETR